jgi:hypothetical protein
MAELLAANGLAEPGSVAEYLRDRLPDDHIIVADAVVMGRPFDAILVAPSGLTILQVVEWSAVAPLAVDGVPGAARVQQSDFAASAQGAIDRLQAFLRDEFPSLKVAIRHLHVARDPEARIPTWRGFQASGLREEPLEETLMSTRLPPDQSLSDEKTRESLAVALRDRKLTVSQRASKPFVFRSGGFLRAGTKAWTIRDAVRYMDRHPEDGIYHLRNGTLAEWLDAEGAPHLAELARNALIEARADGQMALEIFLTGSGLVSRPRPQVHPRRIDLGYVLEGETAEGFLQVRRKGGYLFGELGTSELWLRAEPKTFRGGPVNAVVSATTRNLLIRPEAYEAQVLVKARGSGEPVAVPVRLHVVAMPSAWARRFLRPLTGLALGGALGAGAGLLWGIGGLAWPDVLAKWNLLGPQKGWGLPLAVVWGVLGIIWGATLPPVWPTPYAVRRWLTQIVAWAAGLAVLAAVVVGYWSLASGASQAEIGSRLVQAALGGVAVAVIPAVIRESAAGKRRGPPQPLGRRERVRRLVLAALAAVLLVLAVVFGPRFIQPTWQRLEEQGVTATARGWLAARWEQLNHKVDEVLDSVYLRYYDRRAPTATPTALPTATAAPTEVPQAR